MSKDLSQAFSTVGSIDEAANVLGYTVASAGGESRWTWSVVRAWLTPLFVPISTKGQANGVASLDGTGKVPLAQLSGTAWGSITGTLSAQSDLAVALNAKVASTTLASWTGASTISTVGTIGSGIWNGTSIGDSYIASAATWNAKEPALGNPSVSGYVLSSTTGGARTWIAMSGGGGGSVNWGAIAGTLSEQGDLNTALTGKVPTSRTINGAALTSNVTLTKSDVGLSAVENTALSTWAGSVNIATTGTITSGTWSGTPIADSYISSASAWSAKEPALGNPGVSGYVLSSTNSGTRSWVAAGSGSGSTVQAVQYSTVSITGSGGTSAQTLLGGSTRGSFTIPANTLVVGSVIRVKLYGRLSGVFGGSAGACQLNVNLGGNATFTGISLYSGGTNYPFVHEVDFTVTAVGASANAAYLQYHRNTGSTPLWSDYISPAVGTFDSTASVAVAITGTFSSAQSGNVCRLDSAVVEIL